MCDAMIRDNSSKKAENKHTTKMMNTTEQCKDERKEPKLNSCS